MKCPTCGDELKVIVVQVPIMTLDQGFLMIDDKVACYSNGATLYEEREEVCDCPRCTGGY